jgi:ABC-type dipeptide/oligopeptide/nickel transport system permease component
LMPSFTLALFGIAAIMRVTRSAMLEQLDTNYVRFLRSKGLPETWVIWKHMLRNALVPVVALSGVLLATLIGGAVIIESVFNWPGLGGLVIESVVGRDYPIIQAAVAFTSVCLVLLNLTIDLIFGIVDPRIRYQ